MSIKVVLHTNKSFNIFWKVYTNSVLISIFSAIINKVEMFAPSTIKNELYNTTNNNSIRDNNLTISWQCLRRWAVNVTASSIFQVYPIMVASVLWEKPRLVRSQLRFLGTMSAWWVPIRTKPVVDCLGCCCCW